MALILVVDDSSFARKVTTKILHGAGHETIDADNAERCFELLSEKDPEVIILDMLMPGKSGLEVIGELKEKNIEIPVIVQTADIQESVKKQCLDAGATCVVNKPSNPGELIKAIKVALGA